MTQTWDRIWDEGTSAGVSTEGNALSRLWSEPSATDREIQNRAQSQERAEAQRHLEIYNGPQQLIAGPEPGILDRAKQWIRERTGYFEPPIYGKPFYRNEHPFRTLAGGASYYSAAYLNGRGLSVPDILANKLTGAEGLTELVERETGFTPGNKRFPLLDVTPGELLEFSGGLKSAGAVSKLLVNRIGARWALRRMLQTSLTFAGRQLADEAAQKVITGEPIDLAKVWEQGGIGVLFGIADVALAKGIERWSAGKLADEYGKRIPGLEKIPRAERIKTAQAAIDSHRVAAGEMSAQEWHAKWADHLQQFSDKLRDLSAEAAQPALPGAAAQRATLRPPAGPVQATESGLAYVGELRRRMAAGQPLGAGEIEFLRELGVTPETGMADSGLQPVAGEPLPVAEPAQPAEEVVPQAGTKISSRPEHVYRAGSVAGDFIGGEQDRSYSNTMNWYEGDGFLVEYSGAAATGEGATNPEAYRGDISGRKVTRVYYEPEAYASGSQDKFNAELDRLRAAYPEAQFVRMETRETSPNTFERFVAQAPAQPAEAVTPTATEPLLPEVAAPIGGPSGGLAWHTAIREALGKSIEIRPQIELEVHEERSRRAGAYEADLKAGMEVEKLPAEKALQRAKRRWTGPLTDYQRYEGIRSFVPPETIAAAFEDIATTDRLRPYERANTADAFTKLVDGYVLAPWETEMIARWRPELADVLPARTARSSAYDMVMSVWRAGLLTGIKTTGLNTLSNLFHALSEMGKDVPAVGFDSVASLFTGQRTVGLTARGTVQGAQEGFGKGWEYLTTGFDSRHTGLKYDYHKVNFGRGPLAKALQIYTETIFRLLGAEDQPFYYGAMARSLYSQAIARGRTAGLRGAALQSYVDRVILDPPDDMVATATEDADTAVFANRTKLGDLGRAMQNVGLTPVVPFSRTPAAIAMQVLNYTPIGLAKEALREAAAGKFDQRKMAQAFGRSTFGTGALAAGAALLAAGVMTLRYPKSERERNQWVAEGRKENSILINGKWRSVFILGPLGNVLLIGGYLWQGWQDTGSVKQAAAQGFGGAGRSLMDQTFLQGLNQILAAINEPERSWDSFFSSLGGSLVPTLVADIARAQDTTERRTSGPVQRIASRIPGYPGSPLPSPRQTLEPRLDVFGNDVPRYGGNILEVMVDPTRPVKIRADVVVDELRRLWDADVQVTPTTLGERGGYDVLSDHENTVLWRKAGQGTYAAIHLLIQNPRYRMLSDENKGKEIERVVKYAKDWVRAEAAIAAMDSGRTLTELKEGKLVTADVERLMPRARAMKGVQP